MEMESGGIGPKTTLEFILESTSDGFRGWTYNLQTPYTGRCSLIFPTLKITEQAAIKENSLNLSAAPIKIIIKNEDLIQRIQELEDEIGDLRKRLANE